MSVNHIVPLVTDFDRRLDNDNLVTLCSYHHELAERGRIPARVLLDIAAEQEDGTRLSVSASESENVPRSCSTS